MKPTISKPFKSNDRTFDKVYNAFDKRDYFNSQGLAKVQIGNFERALKKNDKGAQQILDMFKGDEKKAKDYITQVISDRNKERAFNNYKALKDAVDSIQKGKPNVGAVDYVKRIIHNSSQKYSIALYSTLRNKKFTKWKDVHNDIDSLIGEGSVNEILFIVDKFDKKKQDYGKVYYQDGGKRPGDGDLKKANKELEKLSKKHKGLTLVSVGRNSKMYDVHNPRESVNEIDTKKANLLRTNMPGYVGPKFAKKASDEDILAMADLKDQKARIYNRYVKVVDDAIAKLQKKYRIKESVNEAVITYGIEYKSSKNDRKFKKASLTKTTHNPNIDKMMIKAISKDAKSLAKQDGWVDYRITKDGIPVKESVNEGKKRYYQQDRVGSAKYTISYHDGKKKHKDGSDFFDIQTFKNKKDLAKFVNTLHKGGFVYGFNESEDGVPQGYNPMVESKTKESKVIQKVYQYSKTEKKFYDELAKHEVRIGQRDYAKFIINALKGFGINPRQFKRIPEAEEKLYQTVSK